MTLSMLVLYIGIVALILTLLVGFKMRGHKSWLMTFLQNFCGTLFVFSGWVKAVDPLGTAYKMEEYFAEFQSTFSETWFSFLSPVFPWLSEHSVLFSVVMIVFEIVLGLLLLMGAKTKLTSWAFLLLVGFFAVLTGFTYLTGYVPGDANFFEFGKWVAFEETNMKVTDCGCFGDFLKLKPKISFFKDLVLLVPAFIFIFRHKDMHRLFSKGFRRAVIWVSIIGLTAYCMSNYMWDVPQVDFRPFKVGVNIGERKLMEEEAESNVQITAYKMTNKATGKVVQIPYEQYLKEFKNYPKEEWALEQIKTEPSVPHTKISDFDISDIEGNDVTEEILSDPNYSFMVVAYKIFFDAKSNLITVNDTTFVVDTIPGEGATGTLTLQKRVASIKPVKMQETTYEFDANYRKRYTDIVNPVLEEAEKVGLNIFGITAYADPGMLDDFRHSTQSAYPFYVADDILLKTIVRSNPGVVLLKNGKIIQKWHFKKLPSFEKIKETYFK